MTDHRFPQAGVEDAFSSSVGSLAIFAAILASSIVKTFAVSASVGGDYAASKHGGFGDLLRTVASIA